MSLFSDVTDHLLTHGSPPARLVQKNIHEALLRVGEHHVTTFLAEGVSGTDGAAVVERFGAVARTERALPREGAAFDRVIVVLFGTTPAQEFVASLPVSDGSLRCEFRYLHVDEESLGVSRVARDLPEEPPSEPPALVQVEDALRTSLAALRVASPLRDLALTPQEDSKSAEELILAANWPDGRGVALVDLARHPLVGLAVVWVSLFGLQFVFGGPLTARLTRMGGFEHDAVANGALHLLFSAGLLHVSVLHLLGSLYGLFYSEPLYRVIGGGRTIALYVLGCVSGFVGAYVTDEQFAVGASGGLFALLAAQFTLALRDKGIFTPQMKREVGLPTAIFLGVNLLYSLKPGVSLAGHVGGALFGAFVAITDLLTGLQPVRDHDDGPRRAERRAHAFGAALMAAMVLSVGSAIVLQKPWNLRTPPPVRRHALEGTSFSIDLPDDYARPRRELTRDGQALYRFGTVSRHAYAVLLSVERGAVSLEQFRDELAHRPRPRNARIETAPTIVTVAGRLWVYQAQRIQDLRTREWYTRVGDQYIGFNVGFWDDTNDAWMTWVNRGPSVLHLE